MAAHGIVGINVIVIVDTTQLIVILNLFNP